MSPEWADPQGVVESVSPVHSVEPETRPRILIVEDDPEISGMLRDVLSDSGFTTSSAVSAAEMDAVLGQDRIDLVLLDIMLPGEDGFSICRRLRAASTIPVIMVTARSEDVDRIVGLEIGADDYISKPFNARELVARIRALLRRTQGGDGTARARMRPLAFAGRVIDPISRQLRNPEGLVTFGQLSPIPALWSARSAPVRY
ncbi:response regulator [Inquilinus sp. OTU3971]|uniref:response regulator n=1 Tax=Inquilinus sp. OTU3971 TaxID=3043855 RepID=UPI00313C2BAC